jgi:hypothetical protein
MRTAKNIDVIVERVKAAVASVLCVEGKRLFVKAEGKNLIHVFINELPNRVSNPGIKFDAIVDVIKIMVDPEIAIRYHYYNDISKHVFVEACGYTEN